MDLPRASDDEARPVVTQGGLNGGFRPFLPAPIGYGLGPCRNE